MKTMNDFGLFLLFFFVYLFSFNAWKNNTYKI